MTDTISEQMAGAHRLESTARGHDNGVKPDWDDEQTGALLRMWDENKTYGQMALQLGVTRNAVAGKCSRMKLRRNKGRK